MEQQVKTESLDWAKDRIHAALERNSGDRIATARELGITLDTLKNKIYASPDLRKRWAWGETTPIDEVAALSRETISVDEQRLAEVISKEDEKIKKGLKGLGLNQKEAEMAFALQKFNRECFTSTLDLTNGGVTKAAIKLQSQLEEVEKRLNSVRATITGIGNQMTDERVFWVEEEEKLSKQYTEIVDMLRRILQTSFEGTKTLAIIKFKQQANGGNRKSEKPGFKPIDT